MGRLLALSGGVWRGISHELTDRNGSLRNGGSFPKEARARDYYRAEDVQGRRYWVFREGLYDDNRGGPPQWFVHGLFA